MASVNTEEKFFFDDFLSAYEEAQRRRKYLAENGVAVRVEESPYGEGYCLRYIPVAAFISTGIIPPPPANDYGNDDGREARYSF
jgi:hypothetical protein